MAAPDIYLGKGDVLLVSSSSTLGIIPVDNKIAFGTVELVSDLTDRFVVGNSVSYNPSSARKMIYGSTIYWLVKEDDIFGTEVTPP